MPRASRALIGPPVPIAQGPSARSIEEAHPLASQAARSLASGPFSPMSAIVERREWG